MVRKLGLVVMIVSAVTLGACSSTPATSPSSSSRPSSTSRATTTTMKPAVGVVTGIVQPCTGLASFAPSHVKVQLYSSSTLVASDTVRADAKYRFSIAPGSYRLKGWWGFRTAVIRAGRTLTVNFPDLCK